MTTLVVGASGATGRLLVEQLLERGENVRVIVRSPGKLSDDLKNQANLSVIHASLLDLSDAEMVQHVSGCRAVASCLGHNLNFKGIYGHPRRLVTDATRRLCGAIKASTSRFHLGRSALSGFCVSCCRPMWTTNKLLIICVPRSVRTTA